MPIGVHCRAIQIQDAQYICLYFVAVLLFSYEEEC